MTTRRNKRTRVAAAANGDSAVAVARRAIPMRTFAQSLPMALLRAREAVMRRFRPGLRIAASPSNSGGYCARSRIPVRSQVTELASATFLLPPSLSRILPDMEARPLIRRRQADDDLRRSVISLEQKGLRLIATHAPYSEEIYDGIEAHFGTERLAQLFTLLRNSSWRRTWKRSRSGRRKRAGVWSGGVR